MNAIVLVLIGMLVVIAGIVVLRLHAFLALILAAILVAALTPSQRLADAESASHFIGKVKAIEGEPARVYLSFKKPGAVQVGDRVEVLKADPIRGGYLHLSELRIEEVTPGTRTIIAAYHGPHDGHAFAGDSQANVVDVYIAPGDPLVYPQDLRSAVEPGVDGIGSRVAAGFGKTCVSVAILIAMAAVVGQCLLRSGAAERIVNTALATVGEKRAPVAFTFSGFLLAIPVFFDTVFLLLIPLGKELRIKTGKNYTLYVMSIVAGGTMAHSLVPPTPGPLLAASQLNVPVGTMMLGGTIVGLFTVSAGLCYAYWLNKRLEIPLRESADAPDSSPPPTSEARVLPPMWFALLPIALPVVLIAANSILSQSFKGVDEANLPGWWLAIEPMLSVVGDKNIAITLAAGVALLMMLQYGNTDAKGMRSGVQKALESGGVIILITAAGGAFGAVLQQTGIANEFKRIAPDGSLGLWLLPLAYIITTMVRTAQGSATVSMITAAGIVGPIVIDMVNAGTLPFNAVYMALAIACGSKPISWMNDSGFWVIGRMSGMTEGETFKTSSMIMIVMSVTGLAVVMLGAWLLPFA